MSTIVVKCPHCGLSRQVPKEKLPAQKVSVSCPACKETFIFISPPTDEELTNIPLVEPKKNRSILAEIGLFICIVAFATIYLAKYTPVYLPKGIFQWVLLLPVIAVVLSIISLFSKHKSKKFPVFTVVFCLTNFLYFSMPALRNNLNDNFNLNISDRMGNTPLHYAARAGDLEKVRTLITSGANLEIRDKHDGTPLLNAIKNKQIEAARMLLDAGADPNATCGDKRIIVEALRSLGQPGLEMLLSAGADIDAVNYNDDKLHIDRVYKIRKDPSVRTPGRTALFYALVNPELTAYLLDKGANPNAATASGVRPLHVARVAESARLLISYGADVNATEVKGNAPLHIVTDAGTAKVLISNGADLEIRNKDQLTPLLRNFTVEVVQVLLEAGADKKATDKRGRTALHLASMLEFTDVLVQGGLDVNARTGEDGKTSLYMATERESLEIVNFLLKNGADSNIHDQYGSTPLHVASGRGLREIVRTLLLNGAAPNLKTKTDAPLHLATRNGHVGTIKLLLEHGADRKVLNRHGRTPLEIARSVDDIQKRTLLVELLTQSETDLQTTANYTD